MINNSCNSGSVQFDKAVRRWNNDILKSFSDLLTDLLAMNDKFLDCCEETNGNYQDIINQLDVLIQNLIDCCEAICDGLDEWIDELTDPYTPVYLIQWTDYICENIPEEDYPQEAEYQIIWDDYICEQVDESEIPPELVDYEIDFIDYICEQEWECDVAAEFVGCLEDEPEIDYDLLWQDYVCQVEIHEYIAAWDGYICIQECRIDVSGVEVDCEDVTTTVEITTTETPATTVDPLSNCVEYGYLYNWYAATDARNISSSDDWVIPRFDKGVSNMDFEILVNYIGGEIIAGGKLKEAGFTYWDNPNEGATNESNFNARGSGYRINNGAFGGLKQNAIFWTDEENYSPDFAITATLGYTVESFTVPTSTGFNASYKEQGNSIRLVRTSTPLFHGETGTYIGNDGKIYPTICIGTQEWIAANLAETLYRNGDPIPTVEDDATWAGLTTGAKCAYDNNLEYVGCDEEAPTTTDEPPATTTVEPTTTTAEVTTTEVITTTELVTTTQELTTTEEVTTTTTTTIPYLEPTALYDDRTYSTVGAGGAFCDEVNYPLNFPSNFPPTQPYDMLFDFYMGLGLTYENVEYIEIISVDSGDITYSYNGSPIYAGQIIYSNGTSSWEHGDIVKTMLNYIGCEFYTYTDIYIRAKLYGYQISPPLQWRILIDGTSCICPTTTTTP